MKNIFITYNFCLGQTNLSKAFDSEIKAKKYLKKVANEPKKDGNAWSDKKYENVFWNYTIQELF